MKNKIRLSLAGLFVLATLPAYAAGLPNVTSGLTTTQTWLFGILGGIVTIIGIVQVIRLLMDQLTWGAFGMFMLKAVVAGGVVGLIGYIFTLGQSSS